jgi:tRNA U34 2-thiouridine synthase MnmA/TrmU
MLRKAKQYAHQIGAKFIFTGEVLGERPMSQHQEALKVVEKEAGLQGKILRPLSARLLPETEAEREGWVDRSRLMEIRGRSRKPQIDLATKSGLTDYQTPGGGCLLTEKEFSARLKDLFTHRRRISMTDIRLLRIGRQFRFGENRIVVGRDETENRALQSLDDGHVTYLEASSINGPVTVKEVSVIGGR